jgi:hypothetical protein
MPTIGDEYIPFPRVDTDGLYEKVKSLLEPKLTLFELPAPSRIRMSPPCNDVGEFFARVCSAAEREKKKQVRTTRRKTRLGAERMTAARPKLSLGRANGSRWKLVVDYI